MDIVNALWGQIEPHVFITRDQFARELDNWTMRKIEIQGRPAFITLSKGPEFHFASLDAGHRVTMKMGRAWLTEILDEYGYVTTRTPKDDDRQHRFNRLVGFKAVGADEFFVHYRMGAPACQ